ncbi:MAG: alpha/beta hydrolase [Gammaproteobacteria bacterium]|nr:alpha/beta hydrolase [Gammaproteobacteria bacterium]
MASIRSFFMRHISAAIMKRNVMDTNPHKARHDFSRRMTSLPHARGVRCFTELIDGIDCEWLVPQGCDDAPVIYYLHGGAYVMGSPATHRRLASFIAKAAGMRALLPDYRLAPDHRYPSQLEDSLGVWRALVKGGLDPAGMAIGGDSAGGNLAVATMLALRDAGELLPAASILLSPWLDLAGDGESHHTRSNYDPWFRPERMPTLVAHFCDAEAVREPMISPVFADPAGLPPTLIQVGDHEILLSDATRLADNIRAAGGRADLHIWPDMWHVFQYFIGQMPESRKAIDDIGRFLRSEFSTDRLDLGKNRAA